MKSIKTLLLLSTLLLPLAAPLGASPAWAGESAAAKNQTYKLVPVRKNGSFAFCLASYEYPNKSKITLAMSQSHQINLGVTILDAGFQKDSSYEISYGFDGKEAQKMRARALDEDTLLLQLDVNTSFAQNFAQKRTLEIGGGGKVVPFALAPMHGAIAGLKDCIDQNTPKAPVDLKSTSLPPDLAALLDKAGLKSIITIPLGDTDAGNRPADYLWRTGHLLGGVLELTVPPDKDLPTLINLHIQGLKQRCTGAFSAELGKDVVAGNLTLRPALATCQMTGKDKDHPLAVSMLFVLSTGRHLVLFTHEADATHQAEAVAARDSLLKTIQKQAIEEAAKAKDSVTQK